MTKITVANQAGRIGSQITLGVVSDVASPTRFHWKRNGLSLVAPSEKSYVIRNLSPDDLKAQYTVVVEGYLSGEESEPFTLEEAWAKPATSTAATRTVAPEK